MEFLLFLTPEGEDIINAMISKKVKIYENAPICKKYKQLFGYTQDLNFTICLDNIKNTASPVKHYVNETVYHEAVHIAHICKKQPLGIKNITLSQNKLKDVKNSTNISNDVAIYEMEAYYLEDKPHQVLSNLKKYCF